MKKDGLTDKEYKILDKTLDELYPNKKVVNRLKIMRIHYCIACKYCKYFMETAPIRAKCCNPKAKTKKGNYRILNKKLITLGHFPKWCPLEDWTI